MAFKMNPKSPLLKKTLNFTSPAQKALKGDQHKLPDHLKSKIEAAPGKKESASQERKDLNKYPLIDDIAGSPAKHKGDAGHKGQYNYGDGKDKKRTKDHTSKIAHNTDGSHDKTIGEAARRRKQHATMKADNARNKADKEAKSPAKIGPKNIGPKKSPAKIGLKKSIGVKKTYGLNAKKSPSKKIDKAGQRIIKQGEKSKAAKAEGNDKKAERHAKRAERMGKRDMKRKAKQNLKNSPNKILGAVAGALGKAVVGKVAEKALGSIGKKKSSPAKSFKGLVSKLEKQGKSKEAATKIAGKVANAKMKGAGSGPTAKQKARASSPAKHTGKLTSKKHRQKHQDPKFKHDSVIKQATKKVARGVNTVGKGVKKAAQDIKEGIKEVKNESKSRGGGLGSQKKID